MLLAVHIGMSCVPIIRKWNLISFILQGRGVSSSLIQPGNPGRMMKKICLSLYSLRQFGSGRVSSISLFAGFRNSVEENQCPHQVEMLLI